MRKTLHGSMHTMDEAAHLDRAICEEHRMFMKPTTQQKTLAK